MKQLIIIILLLCVVCMSQTINLHKADGTVSIYSLASIDSVKYDLNASGEIIIFSNDAATQVNWQSDGRTDSLRDLKGVYTTTISGAIPSISRFGYSLRFDGINDIVTTTWAFNETYSRTIEVVATAASSSSSATLAEFNDGSGGKGFIKIQINGLGQYIAVFSESGSGNETATITGGIASSNEDYLVATFDPSYFNFYVNGGLIDSIPLSNASFTLGTMWILGSDDEGNNPFNGQIHAVRFSSVVRSQSEISATWSKIQ